MEKESFMIEKIRQIDRGISEEITNNLQIHVIFFRQPCFMKKSHEMIFSAVKFASLALWSSSQHVFTNPTWS